MVVPEPEIHHSISSISAADWNACFTASVEDHACLAAIEAAGLEGFEWRYLIVREGGRIQAAAAAFLLSYPMESSMTGTARRTVARLRQAFPRLLTPRLICVGSPCTETAPIGFAAGLSEPDRRTAGDLLAQALERVAAQERCSGLGFKDISEAETPLWSAILETRGFQAVPGLPSAGLSIDFATFDEYLARLSSASRRDMRRKLRSSPKVRVEYRTSIDHVLDKVMALYADTRARAEMQFETLTPAYFTGMLAGMPGRAYMVLYWAGDDLLAANLLLRQDQNLIDKFFCMDGDRGRSLNLYYLSWFTNLQFCLEHGLSFYQAGQAGYANKLRLQSILSPTVMFFRHRNPLLNSVLRFLVPRLTADAVQPKIPAADLAPRPMPREAMVAVFALLPLFSAGYQIAAKILANQLGTRSFGGQWLTGSQTWPIILLLLCFEVTTFAMWIYVLARMPLGQAYPLTALCYVLVIAASHFVFGEALTPARLLGSVAIIGGAWLLGSAPDEAAAPS